MYRVAVFCLAAALLLSADDGDVTFRSDVSLVRVDTQVLDRSNRAVTGLTKDDFILLTDGKQQEIRNFASEDLPVDVLLLLDVSGSMRPNVQRIVDASNSALNVLGKDDRIAIMVFDRSTRVRMKFQKSRAVAIRELESLLDQETFDGGTDITRALLDAARYIDREGRKDARRAIVILTDDQTEFDRDEARVGRALAKADTVMSALIAPDMTSMIHGGRHPGGGYPQGGGYPGGTYPRRRYPGGGYPGGGYPGSTWPGGGGGWPGGGSTWPGGGGGWPGGGGGSRYPSPGGGGVNFPNTHSAGTSEIAQASGGDSMRVEDASAFETTLERIRQRYALHFNMPEGVKPGEERQIEVKLASAAASRYAGAEIRYRRVYMRSDGVDHADPVTVSHAPSSSRSMERDEGSASTAGSATKTPRRRVGVDERDQTHSGPIQQQSGGWRKAEGDTSKDTKTEAAPAPQPAPDTSQQQPETQQQKGGWRRVKPGEE